MKLGEALSLRATQVQQMAELSARIAGSVTTQEGDEPPHDPDRLLTDLATLSDEHRSLVARINKTNVSTGLLDDLVEREHLRRLRGHLRHAVQAAQQKGWRYGSTEIKTVAHLNVAACTARIDELSEEIRSIDARIQERNWSTNLGD